jgi:5-methylcytosine-specific restriction protein A
MILLGWNPDRGNDPFSGYSAAVERVVESGAFRCRWPLSRRQAVEGAEVWLLLQGASGRGLAGHGTLTSLLGQGPGTEQALVLVEFDALLPRGDCIPLRLLADAVPGIAWEADRPSRRVPRAAAPVLRALWAEHLPRTESGPLVQAAGTLPPAALARVAVNRYEHDPQARRICLAHHGSSCAACGFSFEEAFGPLGGNLLHVHHLVPASQLGAGYELDPVSDLAPLCPNCHSMAHLRFPDPYTPAELRALRRSSGFLTGSAPTPAELTAQADAARILRAD